MGSPERNRKAIRRLKLVDTPREKRLEVVLWNKLKALELLCRHLGLDTVDRVAQAG